MALKYRHEYDDEYNKMEQEGKNFIADGVVFRD